jgi:hypothetical protein
LSGLILRALRELGAVLSVFQKILRLLHRVLSDQIHLKAELYSAIGIGNISRNSLFAYHGQAGASVSHADRYTLLDIRGAGSALLLPALSLNCRAVQMAAQGQ